MMDIWSLTKPAIANDGFDWVIAVITYSRIPISLNPRLLEPLDNLNPFSFPLEVREIAILLHKCLYFTRSQTITEHCFRHRAIVGGHIENLLNEEPRLKVKKKNCFSIKSKISQHWITIYLYQMRIESISLGLGRKLPLNYFLNSRN